MRTAKIAIIDARPMHEKFLDMGCAFFKLFAALVIPAQAGIYFKIRQNAYL